MLVKLLYKHLEWREIEKWKKTCSGIPAYLHFDFIQNTCFLQNISHFVTCCRSRLDWGMMVCRPRTFGTCNLKITQKKLPGNSFWPFWDGENVTFWKGRLSDLQRFGDKKTSPRLESLTWSLLVASRLSRVFHLPSFTGTNGGTQTEKIGVHLEHWKTWKCWGRKQHRVVKRPSYYVGLVMKRFSQGRSGFQDIIMLISNILYV